MKIRLVLDIEYDDDLIHGPCRLDEFWTTMKNEGDLILHSNWLGDSISDHAQLISWSLQCGKG